jgi:hypothetical protein
VIPAFEYVDFHEGSNYTAFPTKKRVRLCTVLHFFSFYRRVLGPTPSCSKATYWNVPRVLAPRAQCDRLQALL